MSKYRVREENRGATFSIRERKGEGGGRRNYRASFFNAQLPLGPLFHFGGEESRSAGELTERNLGRHLRDRRPTPRNFPNQLINVEKKGIFVARFFFFSSFESRIGKQFFRNYRIYLSLLPMLFTVTLLNNIPFKSVSNTSPDLSSI